MPPSGQEKKIGIYDTATDTLTRQDVASVSGWSGSMLWYAGAAVSGTTVSHPVRGPKS